MPTMIDYMTELVDRLMAGRDAQRGTATGGSQTTLECTQVFQSTLGLTNKHRGEWVYITDVSPTPHVSYEAIIQSVNGTSGVITLDRTLTPTIASGDTVLLTGPFRPTVLKNAINQVLRCFYVDTMFPMGTHIVAGDDNNMEASGTTAWATSAGAATVSKTTAYGSPISGFQALAVEADNAGEFAHIADPHPAVHEGTQIWVSVLARIADANKTAGLAVANGVGHAHIEDLGETGERKWVELAGDFVVPSGVKEIDVHLSCPNSGNAYFDDLIIEDAEETLYPTPSWITKEAQMIDVVESQGKVSAPTTGAYRPMSGGFKTISWGVSHVQIAGSKKVTLDVPRTSGFRRYIVALKPIGNLASDATEGYVEVDAVVEAATVLLKLAKEDEFSAAPYLRDLRNRNLRSGKDRPVAKAVASFG